MAKTKFTPVQMDPAYDDLAKKKAARTAELATARAEHDKLAERLREQQKAGATVSDTTYADRVAALALGKPYVKNNSVSDLERLGKLSANIRELDAAIEFLSTKMWQAANHASIQICGQLKSEHDNLCREMILSLIEASKKVTSQKKFVSDLQDSGVNTNHFVDAYPYFLGCQDKFGQFAAWLDEVSKAGFIKRSDIPPELDLRN